MRLYHGSVVSIEDIDLEKSDDRAFYLTSSRLFATEHALLRARANKAQQAVVTSFELDADGLLLYYGKTGERSGSECFDAAILFQPHSKKKVVVLYTELALQKARRRGERCLSGLSLSLGLKLLSPFERLRRRKLYRRAADAVRRLLFRR